MIRLTFIGLVLSFCFVLTQAKANGPCQGDQQRSPQKSPPEKTKPSERRVVSQGVAVDLHVAPASVEKKKQEDLREGDDAIFQLRISDTNSGSPLRRIYPKAWMDLRERDESVDCRVKVKSFLSSGLQARPSVDFNSYYILALNDDATLSVIDPLFGYGGSKLFTLLALNSTGADWVLTDNGKTLFVSMPASGEVAVINCVTWKVVANVKVGGRPVRISLQPDGQRVWVGYNSDKGSDGESGVAVISTDRFGLIKSIPTGRGSHEIAFTDNDRFAFITNSLDGNVSVIDIRKLKKVGDIKTGTEPASIAFSRKAKMAYVADKKDGTIVSLDGSRLKIGARILAEPGLKLIKFAPDGRFAFVANPANDVVHMLDTASNRIIQTADIPNGPDQIAFSNNLAYVRCLRSEIVLMLPLPQSDTPGNTVSVVDFPGGQLPFGKTANPSYADGIVQAPGEDAVLVGNPGDKAIYYYREGMAAPQGNFSNYGREPRAVMVIDRSFKERSPGVYEATTRLPRAGLYEFALVTDTPRIIHCFPVRIASNPNVAAKSNGVQVEPLAHKNVVWVGENVSLRFKLVDSKTLQLKVGLVDVGALIFAVPGMNQQRQPAKEVEKGIYEIEFQLSQAGVYYIYLQSPSVNLNFDSPQLLILQAKDKGSP